MQVYTELQDAIALIEEALKEIQSTEALERGRQGTAELATESVPASKDLPSLLQASVVHVLLLTATSAGHVPPNPADLKRTTGLQADAKHTRQPRRQRQQSAGPESPHSKRQKQQAESAASFTIGPQLPHNPARQGQLSPHQIRSKPTMHPRNKYADRPPDFEALGQACPDLQHHIKLHQGKATIDFRKPAACKALTKALLQHDFNIAWEVPDGQLVPPVTNRANYIHWIEDLLELSPPTNTNCVTGLDVGCGANCIYPLLGAALNGWRFVGTDITDVAIEWAKRNVSSNPHLANLIEVRRTGQSNKALDPTNLDKVRLKITLSLLPVTLSQ